jgi:hypothetical protein
MAFAQVRRGSNIQLLLYSLVTPSYLLVSLHVAVSDVDRTGRICIITGRRGANNGVLLYPAISSAHPCLAALPLRTSAPACGDIDEQR